MELFRNILLISFTGILLLSTRIAVSDNIDQYLEELQRSEEQYGAYDQSLADAYLGLGAAYEARSELNEATDAYLRGMHIQRVNNGLYDPGQIVYLEELAELEVGRDNWFEASDHLERAYVITAKNHSPDSLPVLKAVSELIDLHLQAHIRGVEDWDKHLVRAATLNQKQLKGAGWVNDDLKFTQERFQRTAYISYQIYKLSTQQVVFKQRGVQQGFSNQSAVPGVFPYFRQGKAALEDSVLALQVAHAEPELIAQRLAEVGDWLSLFGRVNGAKIYYQQAYDLYAGSKGEDAATRHFSEPLQIPTFGIGGPKSKATKKFRYQLDVTASGKTKDIKLLTDREGLVVRDIRRARETVRAVRFRPVLTKDGPVAKLNNTLSVLLE